MDLKITKDEIEVLAENYANGRCNDDNVTQLIYTAFAQGFAACLEMSKGETAHEARGLSKHEVNQQRELLLAYSVFLEDEYDGKGFSSLEVDRFLSKQ